MVLRALQAVTPTPTQGPVTGPVESAASTTLPGTPNASSVVLPNRKDTVA